MFAHIGRLFLVHIDVFRADADPHGLLLRPGHAVVDEDILRQLGAVDFGMVGFVGHQVAFKNIGFADEFGGEAAVGEVVHLAWRAHLLQLAFRHDGDARGHGHGFFLVVRYHDAGYAHLLQRIHQFQLGLLAQVFIQRAQRLVQQQKFGLLGQRAGQRDALLLPTGELVRLAFGVFAHLHQAQHFLHPFGNLVFGHFVLLQAEGDVLLHRHVRE